MVILSTFIGITYNEHTLTPHIHKAGSLYRLDILINEIETAIIHKRLIIMKSDASVYTYQPDE